MRVDVIIDGQFQPSPHAVERVPPLNHKGGQPESSATSLLMFPNFNPPYFEVNISLGKVFLQLCQISSGTREAR